MKVGSAPEDEGTSAKAIRKHLDLSLERLNTDYVDIYYLHKHDPDAHVDQMLGALAAAMRAGKVRHWGVSNYSAEQLKALLRVVNQSECSPPIAAQPGVKSRQKIDEAVDAVKDWIGG